MFAYYYLAILNRNRDLAITLNLYALAAQGAGKDIKEAVDKLLKDA